MLLTYEAGYEGFWLARWLGEHAPEIDVVICDPASLEVVRRKRRAKTDRIDARKMVRALRAWDGGDRDAMSPGWGRILRKRLPAHLSNKGSYANGT